jgi:hypothetical protein
LDEADFVNLPNYHIYLKLLIDGVTSEPFSATTLPLPERGISNRDEVVNESRRRYGRMRNEVEQAILRRYKREPPSESPQKRLF